MPDLSALFERYGEVLGRVADAARLSGRAPEDVRLVAVSKFHPAEMIEHLAKCGQMDFGESYIQEAMAKRTLVTSPVRWHFIGHLQTNKARFLPGNFHLFHALDSKRLAHALHSICKAAGRRQGVLIQVNLAGEAQKSGIGVDGLPSLAETVLALDGLEFQGLMLMPPLDAQGDAARPYFAALRSLRDGLERRLGMHLPHLSMGMSGDYPQAISEGATLIRIGTDIFGPRSTT
jgi:PLP dependent protein